MGTVKIVLLVFAAVFCFIGFSKKVPQVSWLEGAVGLLIVALWLL